MPLGGALVGAAGAAVSAAEGETLGLAKALFGFIDEKKAKKEEDALKVPFYKIQDEYLQNRDLAAQSAETGLSPSSLKYLTKETGRGLSSGISGELQAGGDPNQIASLLDKYTQSIGKLAVEDTALKTQKLGQFLERNAEVAGQKTVQFSINELQPYQSKLKQLQERRAADTQNIFGGLSDAVGGSAALGKALGGKKEPKNTGTNLFTASYPQDNLGFDLNSPLRVPMNESAPIQNQDTNIGTTEDQSIFGGSDADYKGIDWSKINWLAQ